MGQQTFAILGFTFILVAIAGILAMLELWGNPQTRFNKNTLRIVHRTCGYIFITIYVAMLYFMAKRIAMQVEPLTALQTVHVTLAVMIFPLLAIKILIIRRLPGLEEKLPYFGVAIFVLALTLNVITAGFYFLRSLNPRYVSLQFFDRSKLSTDLGRGLLDAKCQKCHTLERVFLAVKTETEWEKTVNTMVARDPSIRDDEAAQIIFYLTNSRSVKPSSYAVMTAKMNLTDTKCGRCHMLERLYREKRPPDEWSRIVDRMVSIEPTWISPEEAKAIKEYLISVHSAPVRRLRFGEKKKSEVNAQKSVGTISLTAVEIFESTCTNCHTHDRIYAKTREFGADTAKWQIIVERMRKNGAPMSDEDIPKMVNFLAMLK